MKEQCPGLPNWEALKECGEAFSTPETAPKGRYLGGPVTWGGFDEERVEALELPFEVVHAGTDAALFAELESAYQRQAPIMLWIYAPHWAPAKYEGEWIEFPPYETACYEDPAWGAQSRRDARLRQAARPDLEGRVDRRAEKWPGAVQAPSRPSRSTNDEMGALITKVDLDGQTVEAVVAEWMAANEATLAAVDRTVARPRPGRPPSACRHPGLPRSGKTGPMTRGLDERHGDRIRSSACGSRTASLRDASGMTGWVRRP